MALQWQSADAEHCERQFFERINFWRDVFPGNLAEQLDAAPTGVSVSQTVSAEELMLEYNPTDIRRIKTEHFRPDLAKVMNIQAHLGRFYPRHFLHGVSDLYSSDRRPCRIVEKDSDTLRIDFNHPLAKLQGTLSGKVIEILEYKQEHGGRCNDIGQDITQHGPGMQARLPHQETDFYSGEPFQRMDPRDDSVFYQQPRLVQHLDAQAIAHVSAIYARVIQPGSKILDLMSSWVSHLPATHDAAHVTGLGMNAEELAQNPQLSEYQVHDINTTPILPYVDNSFDTVICTASVEYLVQPIAVFEQVRRVLKPGGQFVLTFSDRWFPTKAIVRWTELHPFERLGLVLAYFRQAGGFTQLGTESIRYYPRPPDDPHAHERAFSDPVFAVWGRKQSVA
jgi:SAM-dependent methyltransferase/FKBP-type peptidyl-prolyl cis-trans isomerase 2